MRQLTISNELQDKVFVFKISNCTSLSEKMKNVEKPEVFSPMMEHCNDELKVCETFKFKLKFLYKSLLMLKTFCMGELKVY